MRFLYFVDSCCANKANTTMSQKQKNVKNINRFYRNYSGFYSVTPTIIQSINSAIEKFTETDQKIEIRTKGGVHIPDFDPKNTAQLRNSGDDLIAEFKWADFESAELNINVSLERPRRLGYEATLSVSATGTDTEIAFLKQNIESIEHDMSLRGIEMKMVRNNPASSVFTYMFVWAFVSVMLIYIGYKFNYTVYENEKYIVDFKIIMMLISSIAFIFIIPALIIIEKWISKLFPSFYCYIGGEIEEITLIKSKRNILWVVFVAPFPLAMLFYVMSLL